MYYLFDNIYLQWFAGDSEIDFQEEGDTSTSIFWEDRFNYEDWFTGDKDK